MSVKYFVFIQSHKGLLEPANYRINPHEVVSRFFVWLHIINKGFYKSLNTNNLN